MNDVTDRAADRAHPAKRHRPVASGSVVPGHALTLALVLAAAGLILASRVSFAALGFASAYVVLNIGYSAGLKNVAILDVFMIAAGFMLRILAGTVGLGIAPSQWLLLCGLMLTVFLGFSKRRAELGVEGEDARTVDRDAALQRVDKAVARSALAGYTPQLLDRMIWLSAGATLVTYGLYTVDDMTVLIHGTERLVYTVPFVLFGLFRYLYVLYRRGGGADPALEVLGDLPLLLATIGWLAAVLFLIS